MNMTHPKSARAQDSSAILFQCAQILFYMLFLVVPVGKIEYVHVILLLHENLEGNIILFTSVCLYDALINV